VNKATLLTKRRYDRLALFFDTVEAPIERLRFASWRTRLRQKIKGPLALEAGVGTGKNMPYYPESVRITGIDISPRMLNRARKKSAALGINAGLFEMDIQSLAFPDDTFDTVFATFVFCSVPNPILGLAELRRVCKPEGQLLLLEHMRPGNRVFGLAFDLLNPVIVRLTGADINRRTMDNIQRAGWNITLEERLSSDIVRWIEARP